MTHRSYKSYLSYKSYYLGFTMIELLISMALLAIIAGFGLVVSLDSYRGFNFRAEQDLLLSVLQQARSQSMDNIDGVPHGVFIDAAAKQYVLFEGADYASRDSSKDTVYSANPALGISGSSSVVFSQLSATTVPSSIALDDHVHPIYNVCINSEGQINATTLCQ